jgi:hypothetical protein
MKMYPDDWRVRVTAGVLSATCIGAAMLLGDVVGLHRLWPLMLLIVLGMIIGNVLGRLVCRLLFRPPEMEEKDEKT